MQAFAWNCRNREALMAKGEAQAAKTARREYRCRALGRTESVGAMKPGNAGRAKGSGQAVVCCRNNWKQDDDDACDGQTVRHHQKAKSVRGL